jgi:PEP-CTERM motif
LIFSADISTVTAGATIVTPEPSSLLLIGIGLSALVAGLRLRRR